MHTTPVSENLVHSPLLADVLAAPIRYGVADVNGRGIHSRHPTAAVAQVAADKRSCRAYVYDYAAKMTMYRNWLPLDQQPIPAAH